MVYANIYYALNNHRPPCAVNYGILGGINMNIVKTIVLVLDAITAVLPLEYCSSKDPCAYEQKSFPNRLQ